MELTNKGEGFIPIIGYETYKINEKGQVQSPRGNILKPQPCGGYASVWLYKKGGRKQVYVHKVMETMFFSETSEVVNHLDGDKMNPALSNLEPSTESGNLKHAYDTGLRVSEMSNVIFISPQGIPVLVKNISKFCRENKLTRSCIGNVQSGAAWQHNGWRLYAN